ncbi:hypothetical protein TELCIR_18173, partial [Teladorsagia circumcincta]
MPPGGYPPPNQSQLHQQQPGMGYYGQPGSGQPQQPPMAMQGQQMMMGGGSSGMAMGYQGGVPQMMQQQPVQPNPPASMMQQAIFGAQGALCNRAMAYEVRRFPKGLRNYAAPFLTNTKHRKKPPSRYFRRRSRNLLLISHNKQDELISMLSSLCANAASPTFAFKSGLDGRETYQLAIWMHPSCRDQLLNELKELLELTEEESSEDEDEEKVEDLRDQLIRIRLYGPLSISIVSDALKLVGDEKAPQFRLNHLEWRDSVSKLSSGSMADGTVFSLLVEDPRISRPRFRK